MKQIAVYGAGGHGKVVADAAASAGMEVLLFIDDAPKEMLSGKKVLSFDDFLHQYGTSLPVALAIGDNATRQSIHTKVKQSGLEVISVIHAGAIISPSSSIAEGSVIFAGAIVNADADIGKGAIINSGAIIEHDNIIGAYAHISPGVTLGGNVSIGTLSHVGIGSCIIPGVSIGEKSLIAAGSCVLHSLPSHIMAAGTPAIIKKEIDPQ